LPPTLRISKAIMRSPILFLALPALCIAAPPESPQITKIVFSGSGCPNDSGSVRSDTATLGDYAGVSFTQLKGDSTDNCAVHIQSTGGSEGWQAAIREITYEGDVNLRGNSELDTFTQVFWSENAGNTVSPSMTSTQFTSVHVLIAHRVCLPEASCARGQRSGSTSPSAPAQQI
jgi:hypothetical protein